MAQKAVIYARVSSAQQGENYSLESQIEACRQYAREREFQVVGEFTDTISGVTLERPGLSRLRDLLSRGQAEVLIVYSADRLSRSVADFYLIKAEFLEYGVECQSVSGAHWGNEGDQEAFDGEIAYAEFERNKMLERFARGRKRKVQSNKVLGNGIRPFGYRFIKAQGRYKEETVGLEIVEEEAKTIRLLYDWYLNGENGKPLTILEMSKRLEEMQIPSYADISNLKHIKERGYCKWGKGAIYHILRNPLYAGIYTHNIGRDSNNQTASDTETHINIPAIIDKDIWDEVQRRKSKHHRDIVRYSEPKYLLSKRIKCVCGYRRQGLLTASRKYKYAVYQCYGYRSDYSLSRCSLPRFSSVDTDFTVWTHIRSIILRHDFINFITMYKPFIFNESKRKIKILGQALNILQEKEINFLNLYNSNHIDRETLLKLRDSTTYDQIEIQERILLLQNEVASSILPKDKIDLIYSVSQKIHNNLDTSISEQIAIIEILDIEATLFIRDDLKMVRVLSRVLEEEVELIIT